MKRRDVYSTGYVADLIRRFVSGDVEPHEWDDFISVPIEDSQVEAARVACDDIRDRYPSVSGGYSSEEGIAALLRIAEALAVDKAV